MKENGDVISMQRSLAAHKDTETGGEIILQSWYVTEIRILI